MSRKNITTIVRKGNNCVIYNDDGMFCKWTETKPFNLETIQEAKEQNDGIILLVSEQEAQSFAGNHMTMENHEAWILERWIIEMVYGTYPKSHWENENEETKELVRFLRTLQI